MADSLLDRLDASARRIADLRQELRAEMDRRDGMIREAIGRGDRYRVVSTHARRSVGTVASIVGRPES